MKINLIRKEEAIALDKLRAAHEMFKIEIKRRPRFHKNDFFAPGYQDELKALGEIIKRTRQSIVDLDIEAFGKRCLYGAEAGKALRQSLIKLKAATESK